MAWFLWDALGRETVVKWDRHIQFSFESQSAYSFDGTSWSLNNPSVRHVGASAPQHARQPLLYRFGFFFGATVDAANNEGKTPLMLASEHSTGEMVALLLERGARVNAKTRLGETPLMLAS